jgi:hypothetical protein
MIRAELLGLGEAELAGLEDRQGVVYRISSGSQDVFEAAPDNSSHLPVDPW